ncbi:hypothetical protein DA096_08765 [Vibrio rotiferianus]|uniref:hypothetical protein n=1 Tax=Vibrio rotiferianus TaxID=190895 RepID=UPI001110B19A|nr:hypothetical protein [Vibrio rotiferianus]TMX33848.1 hypothetical protein DA095_16345 [Vibrio rotiferianus]TMX55307.1 hypothetical protein DA093_08120 [Vibrio rotiferianus]TMX66268.1 hypothetical protein DA096_08765 [Vibrio rotiferianus]
MKLRFLNLTQYMKLASTLMFCLAAAFSFLGASGVDTVTRIAAEPFSPSYFLLFLYLCPLTAGLVGLTATRQTPTLRSWSKRLLQFSINGLVGIKNGILGLLFGLLAYAVVFKLWQQATVLLALILYFWLLSFQILTMSKAIADSADDKMNNKFLAFRYLTLFKFVCISLIVLCGVGIYSSLATAS